MGKFLNEDFLLENSFAEKLYHDYAEGLPIVDYHNHLSSSEIAMNQTFNNITEGWLNGDHYKWRAMRANAVNEKYITGKANDKEKFLKWSATVPYTARNPLFIWTHLELQRYFGVNKLLNSQTSEEIYDSVNAQLGTPQFSRQNLLKMMKVETVCTTDEPTDTLKYHLQISKEDIGIKVLPTFRPDKFIMIGDPDFLDVVKKLEEVTKKNILGFHDLLEALQERISFFHAIGGRLSDHGLPYLYAIDFTDEAVDTIFKTKLSGKSVPGEDALKYQSALLYHLAKMYYAKEWTMQFHLGAIRNNNLRLQKLAGNDVGCDSIGDYNQAVGLSRFLGRLDNEEQLPKTILYNLNPKDNEVFATMAGNFNDSSIPAKIQWGPAWWFLDQKDGIEKQLNVLSNMGMLSRFTGMITDSRSFLSFPRHEYFRRILCNLIGEDIEKGELPNDLSWLGQMIQDICYNNAKKYFDF